VLFVSELFGILLNVFRPALIVLFVSVSVVALPTNVSVVDGIVIVPPFVMVAIVGDVNVKPAIVDAVPPSDTDVEPIVTELFVSDALPILDNVLLAPLIVLFVSVCAPVNVATVESIATVTAEEPL